MNPQTVIGSKRPAPAGYPAAAARFVEQAWRYLRTELAPTPGRFDAMVRTLLASIIVTIVSMALEVPLLSLSLFVIFMVNQENVVRARMVAIGIVVTATVGAALAILILRYTIDDAAVRIVVCAMVVCVCAYFQRVCKLGILFSLISLVVVFGQAAADDIQSGEVIIRLCLWAWVSVVYPTAVALIINLWVLPARPERQFADEACRQLAGVARYLEDLAGGVPWQPGQALECGPQATVQLLQFQQACASADPHSLWASKAGLLLISAIDQLTATVAAHAAQPVGLSVAQRGLVGRIGAQVHDLVVAIQGQVSPAQTEPWDGVDIPPDTPEVLRDLVTAMRVLFDTDALHEPAVLLKDDPMFVPDAWVNPSYMHVALKTMLSTYICYTIYTGLSWPGIHTAMLTCIIVAVPGLGASTLKGALRIGGCVTGSIAALVATVFIMPHLDSLTGLLLMVVPIVAFSAWVTAGSERISYAGLQVVFAFALSVLDHFGPTTNLTEMRDRLVGVLLGVTVSAIVNVYLWPDSNHEPLIRQARQLMNAINDLARKPQVVQPADVLAAERLRIWTLIAQCEQGLSERLMEPGQQIADRNQLLDLTKQWTANASRIVQRITRARWNHSIVDEGTEASLAELNAQMTIMTNWNADARGAA